jgi:hypothetical protein
MPFSKYICYIAATFREVAAMNPEMNLAVRCAKQLLDPGRNLACDVQHLDERSTDEASKFLEHLDRSTQQIASEWVNEHGPTLCLSWPWPSTIPRFGIGALPRIGRSLERSGLIERDIDNAYLAFDPAEEAPNHGLLGSSITYRIATGPREGQKVFTLQTLPAEPDAPRPEVA